MIINRSAPRATVVPILVYEDVEKADWLCGTFGFTERLRAARPGDSVTHAQLAIAEGRSCWAARVVSFGLRDPTK
jgi:hypothetical protein